MQRGAMKDFRRMQVWHKAHALVLDLYTATARFPREEIYGLTSQTRRAAVSIAANIAEGCGRQGEAELSRFSHIAMGSASELEYHLLLCRDLKLLGEPDYQTLTREAVEVKRMLGAFIVALQGKSRNGRTASRTLSLTADR